MLVALALAWFTAQDQLTLPLLFLLAALHGVARAFVGPAMSAIAPNIVPPVVLPQAIAMSSIAWQSGSVIGPAAGGFLYAADGALTYWVSAALLAFASVAISFVRPVRPPAPEARRHPLREMADGLSFTWRERFLLGAITLDLFAVLLGSAVAMLPVFARDILMVGTGGLGQLRAAPAVGASLVALWLAFRPMHHNVGVKMLWGVVVFGIGTIGLGLSTNFLLSLAMLALMGAADMLSVYVRSSLVQLNTPDTMRGRVSAISGLAISASNELGEMRCGAMAALVGPVSAVVAGGVAAIAVTGLWAYCFPELRRARTFEPQFRNDSP
jgi:MFS family permease